MKTFISLLSLSLVLSFVTGVLAGPIDAAQACISLKS